MYVRNLKIYVRRNIWDVRHVISKKKFTPLSKQKNLPSNFYPNYVEWNYDKIFHNKVISYVSKKIAYKHHIEKYIECLRNSF